MRWKPLCISPSSLRLPDESVVGWQKRAAPLRRFLPSSAAMRDEREWRALLSLAEREAAFAIEEVEVLGFHHLDAGGVKLCQRLGDA